jgi:sortase A
MVLALLVTGVVVAFGGAPSSVAAGNYTITATPTTNVVDGQRVSVNVKAASGFQIFGVELRECRLDATYTVRADMLPPAGKCPLGTVSSSADQVVIRGSSNGITTVTQTPDGATIPIKVGVGTVEWALNDGSKASLTCDPDHPCALVAQIATSTGLEFWTTELHFGTDDPLAGCGGAAKGIVSTAGSDQMSDAWSAWSRDACTKPGFSGAPTRGVFSGEGLAMTGFTSGDVDLAYTAAGYDSAIGLGPTDPSTQRDAVATPVALNAAVIAVGGGYRQDTGDKAPYPPLKVTVAEMAAMFAGGVPYVIRDDLGYKAGILNRNPSLGGSLFATVPTNRPMAPAEAEASSWYMTNYFTKFAAADWVSPRDGDAPRGASAAIATAVPGFTDLDTFSGRPLLQKVTDQAADAVLSVGPIWAMTDLATAKALGMTPVAIQAPDGSFVSPTPENMAAAVATMKPDDHGLLQPDPQAAEASAAVDGVTPYPLTYVQYALTPAQPLVEADCTLRTDSQALLTKWLTYVTTDGQSNLPEGFVGLPDSLEQEAAASIQKVGATPLTGACAGTGGTGTTGNNTVAASGSTGGLGGTSVPTASRIGTSSPTPNALTPNATSPVAADAKDVAIAVPAFAGHKLPDTNDGIVALIGIVVLTSLAAWVTSGYGLASPSPTFAGGVAGGAAGAAAKPKPPAPKPVAMVALWLAVAIAGFGLVVYQLGPMLQQRDQRDLLSQYRTEVRHAANATSGLPGAQQVTNPPAMGDPVGILEIPELQAQNVVVEGAGASETQQGPGHVPGSAGLGQPGNSAVVARRNAFGGAFRDLSKLRNGDKILVTTTQGQTLYVVSSVGTKPIVEPKTDGSTTDLYKTKKKSDGVTADALYGPTKADQLTLVTSASRQPWNSSDATVVTAKMQGKPFEPTPQNGRSASQTGTSGNGSWASVVLVLMLYAAAVVASILLYRKMRFRVAYILTIAPLVALTVVVGETLSRLLPAWM